MLLRLAYLAVTNGLALLRLLPMSARAKDVEILTLRHQITVLERQLGAAKVRFAPADRAFLAALLHLCRAKLTVEPVELLLREEPELHTFLLVDDRHLEGRAGVNSLTPRCYIWCSRWSQSWSQSGAMDSW
jgi:putative transposase